MPPSEADGHLPAGLTAEFRGWTAIARCSCGTEFTGHSDLRAWAENAAHAARATHIAYFTPEEAHSAVE